MCIGRAGVSDDASPRPDTLALDARIREAVTQAQRTVDPKPADSLLFLGNRHESFPTLVITDPVLEPVDKLVWMVIMLGLKEATPCSVFPGYVAIARSANIASRSTVARAIAILRVTRWLTLCARVRKASGRFCGNLYALHDEPLPLADAFHLDTGYLAFVDSAVAHGHARVRSVAQGMLDSMDGDIRAGCAVGAQEHPVNRRLDSQPSGEAKPARFYDFTKEAIAELQDSAARSEASNFDHDQNSNSGSSSYNYKTTTTTPELSKFDITGEDDLLLVYPKRLLGDQLEVARRYLRALGPETRQPVLDELEGRFRAEAQGMAPLYDELRFLHALCRAVKGGTFQPNLGIRVRHEREQSTRSNVPAPAAAPVDEEEQQRRRAVGKANLGEIREMLGGRKPRDD